MADIEKKPDKDRLVNRYSNTYKSEITLIWLMSGKQAGLKKIVLLGTTGSGKTTFLKNLAGDFEGAEVSRNVMLEENQKYNTFTPHAESDFADSTTTTSLNAQPILFLITKTNNFEYYLMKKGTWPIDKDIIDCVYPTMVFDPAGQERFEFMQDIGIQGCDAAFIFADGSNVASIERISKFITLIKKEAMLKIKKIPITIFVNKKDLESRGLYVGAAAVHRWIEDDEIGIEETTNLNPETFLIPIRNVLDSLDGFPITIET